MKKFYLLLCIIIFSYQGYCQCGFSISSIINDETCLGYHDGSIIVNPTGGIPPYLYSLNLSTYQTNNNFNSLSQGDYTIHVQDSTGCIDSSIIHISYLASSSTTSLTSIAGTDSQTVCLGNSIINIVYTAVGLSGGIFVSGLPAGVYSSLSGTSLTISGSPIVSGYFPYTVITTGVCTNSILTGYIKINANTDLILNSSSGTDTQTVCEGANIVPISYSTIDSSVFTVIGIPTGITPIITANQITLQGSTTSGIYPYQIIANGICNNDTTTGVISVFPTPNTSFSYASSYYCNAGINPLPLITGLSGGQFSVAPSGLIINPVTGEIDFTTSTSGNFLIQYQVTSGCISSSTFPITLSNMPCADFSYSSSSYCNSLADPTPIFPSSCTMGVFNSSPFGLVMNAATGKIDLDASIPGTYTITNFIGASMGCPSVSHTEIITIHETPVVSAISDQYLCYGGLSNVILFTTTIPGSNFLWSNNNISIGIGSSGNSNSIPSFQTMNTGTNTNIATFFVTPISPDFCYGNTQSFQIYVSANSQQFYYPTIIPCQTVIDPIVCSIGGVFSSTTGLSLNTTSGEIDISSSLPGSYTVTYITTTPVADTSEFIITIPNSPNATFQYPQATYCQTYIGLSNPLPILTNPGGQLGTFTSVPSGIAFDISNGIDINSCIPHQYKIFNTITGYGLCPTIVDSFDLTIYPFVHTLSSTIIDDCSCQGSIEPHSSGGLGPKTYYRLPYVGPGVWDYTDSVVSSTSPNNAFLNLCAGTYGIMVKDSVGCLAERSDTLDGLIQITNQQNPLCHSSNDGMISFNFNTPTSPPYTYVLNPSGLTITSSNLNATFSSLSAGNYTITASDTSGIICNSIFTLIDPPSISLSSSTIDAICGLNGDIQMTAIGGTGSFSFSLMPGGLSNTSGHFSNLSNVTYTIQVNDAAGCTSNDTITINGTSMLTGVLVSNTSYDESCFLAGDGLIHITTSPISGLSFLWNTGDTTQDLLNAVSGNYTLQISNGSGDCLIIQDTIQALGLNCGTISGQIYFDSLSDCMFNTGDFPLANIEVELSNGALAFSNSNGEYVFTNVPYGSYTITQNLSSFYSTNSCPQPNNVVLNSISPSVSNLDFIDSIIQSIDIGFMIASPNYVPGFNNAITLYSYSNLPDSTLSTISFLLNDSLDFISSSPSPTSIIPTINGDSLVWIMKIPPYAGTYSPIINVTFNTPSTYPLGNMITSCGSIMPNLLVDTNLINNSYCVTKPISSSFDPNDKSVQPIGIDSIGGIYLHDSILDYRINFQNTGTSEAVNIKILDTLSSNLNFHSFEVIASTHPYFIEVLSDSILQIKFNHIFLPDSNSNEPESHGFMMYRIHLKPSLQAGDQIQNSASIYFDYNSPILTNTTLNTILEPLQISESIQNNQLEIYPIPINNEIHINALNEDDIMVYLFDATGRCILSKLIPGKSIQTLNVQHIPSGNYLFKAQNDRNVFTKKITILH